MTNIRASRARRIAAASLIAASLVGVSACSAINEQATTKVYAASDGVNIDVAANGTTVDFRNMMIVTNGKGKPGRVLGKIVNNSDKPVTVSFSVAGTELEKKITVPAGIGKNAVNLTSKDAEITVPSVEKVPGEEIEMTVKVDGTTASKSTPVLDGTLEQYREYLPGGYSPAATPSASPSASHAAGH